MKDKLINEKVIVTNIQRFCLHDGPGIRTTVFMKGCNLRCPWCSNPENLEHEIQTYEYDDEAGKYGYEITLADLEKEILKDKNYFDNGGGVTFSGGEALLQFDKLKPLLENLKEENINVCLETALMVSNELVDIAVEYVNEFIVDVKILDEKGIFKINGNIDLFKRNIDKLFRNKCNVIFRIPLVLEYTLTDENIQEILDFLQIYKPSKVEIFKIHRLGEKKYKTLNMTMPEFKDVDDKQIENLKEKIKNIGIEILYCKI